MPLPSNINPEKSANFVKTVKDIIAEPIHYAMKPQVEAENYLIEEIKKSDNLDPFTKAALIKNVRKIIKEYVNSANIYEITRQHINHEALNNTVDPDWLKKFDDSISQVSSEEFQIIWGRILATECNKPGSIPKNLLYILERMDKESAEDFVKICRTVVKIGDEYSPVIPFRRINEISKYGINLDVLMEVNELGLIEYDLTPFSNGYAVPFGNNDHTHVIKYCNEFYDFNINRNSVSVGSVLFTRTGTALFHFLLQNKIDGLGIAKLDGYWEEICVPQFKMFEKEKEE